MVSYLLAIFVVLFCSSICLIIAVALWVRQWKRIRAEREKAQQILENNCKEVQ